MAKEYVFGMEILGAFGKTIVADSPQEAIEKLRQWMHGDVDPSVVVEMVCDSPLILRARNYFSYDPSTDENESDVFEILDHEVQVEAPDTLYIKHIENGEI